MGLLADLGHFAGGATDTLHTGFGLRQARGKMRRDEDYRLALKSGLGTDGSNPNYERASTIAAEHGRAEDATRFAAMADRGATKVDRKQARAAGIMRNLLRAGDLPGISRFVKTLPPSMFGLEEHRKPDGIDIRTGPDGKSHVALMIRNTQTRTRGPQTERGTPDAKDSVISMPIEAFDSYLSAYAPAGEQGEWKHDTKGGLYHTLSGARRPGPADTGDFTLSAGQGRYDAEGNLIAARPTAPGDGRRPRQHIKLDNGDIWDPESRQVVYTASQVREDREEAEKLLDDIFPVRDPQMPGIDTDKRNAQATRSAISAMSDHLFNTAEIPYVQATRFLANALAPNSELRAAVTSGNLQDAQAAQAELVKRAEEYFGIRTPEAPAGNAGPLTNQDLARATQLLSQSGIPDAAWERINMMFKRGEIEKGVNAILRSRYAQDPLVRQALEIMAGGR